MRRALALLAAVSLAGCPEPEEQAAPPDAGATEPADAATAAIDDAGCRPLPEDERWSDCWGAYDCRKAWKEGLSPCDKTPDDYLVVRKSVRNLAVCQRGQVVENFQVGLGFAPVGDKEREGDGKTPEGVFYVAELVPDSSYYKAFLLSYPDKGDADRGLADGQISQAEFDAIYGKQDACEVPPQTTDLGSWLEVHGKGGKSDWTLGCVAIDSVSMDFVWERIDKLDTIVIYP